VTRTKEAAGCPDQETLQRLVERILERPLALPPAESSRRVAVEVAFHRDADGFTAEVRLSGETRGERALRDASPTCAALADAAAVTIALSLDDRAQADEAARVPAERPPPLAPEAEQRFPVWAGATAGVGFGQVGAPSFAAGIELGADALRNFPVRIGGVFVLPHDNPLPPGGVHVSLIAGEVAVCRALFRLALAFRTSACADLQIGALRGEGHGFASTTSGALTWTAAGARLDLEGASLGPFVWGLQGSVLAPLQRLTFSVESLGIAYDSSAVVGTIAVRAGVRLW
jgi:hypothetical protein